MTPRRRRAGGMLAATVLAATLTGCSPSRGGDATPPANVGANNIADQGPYTLFAEAGSTLSTAHGYKLRYAIKDSSGLMVYDVVTDGKNDLRATISTGPKGEMVLAQGRMYVRGAALFSKELGKTLPDRYADSWVRLPQAPPGISTFADAQMLSKCMQDASGTLTTKGVHTVDRVETVEVDAAGDADSGTPGKFYVTGHDQGTAFVRWTYGPTGGQLPASCNGGQEPAPSPDGSVSSSGGSVSSGPEYGVVDFLDFGPHDVISTPENWVDYDQAFAG